MQTFALKTETVSPADLCNGDTILVNGESFTFSPKDLQTTFSGTTVRGQRFPKGVQRILYPRWKAGKFVGYSAQ